MVNIEIEIKQDESFSELRILAHALEESVKLQSHYARLLNIYDGGERMQFASAEEWTDRLQYMEQRGGSR